MMNLEWITALAGGVLIGLAASLFLLFNGKIFGISGIVGGSLMPQKDDFAWRIFSITGLIAGGVLLKLFSFEFVFQLDSPMALFIAGGFLVGFGTRLGNGCTSGHGVCGVGRLAPRSIVATVVFSVSGMVAVFVVRHLLKI